MIRLFPCFWTLDTAISDIFILPFRTLYREFDGFICTRKIRRILNWWAFSWAVLRCGSGPISGHNTLSYLKGSQGYIMYEREFCNFFLSLSPSPRSIVSLKIQLYPRCKYVSVNKRCPKVWTWNFFLRQKWKPIPVFVLYKLHGAMTLKSG